MLCQAVTMKAPALGIEQMNWWSEPHKEEPRALMACPRTVYLEAQSAPHCCLRTCGKTGEEKLPRENF